MDADSADEDSSGSEDEGVDDDDDDDDGDHGSLDSFIDGSEEAVDRKEEFDKSKRRLALELDAVFDGVERLERKEGDVVGKTVSFGVWDHEHSPRLSHADAEVRRS